ncbi:MAG: DUF4012 domain-containing protein [Patescibacteria group bacterium]
MKIKKIDKNIFSIKTKQKKTASKRKRYITIALVVIGAVLAIFSSLFFVYKKPATLVYEHGIQGRDDFLRAQDELLAQEFTLAHYSLVSAVGHFQQADAEFNKFKWLRFIPLIGSQISALDNLLQAGIVTGESIKKINDLVIGIVIPLQQEEEISLSTLTEEQTEQLLKSIHDAKPELEASKALIDDAVVLINQIPDSGLIGKLQDAAEPLKENVPSIQSAIDQAISASQIIPSIAGYPDEKTYLFLLQNNTELRPTGGFIGTYGILKIKNGEITEFTTDNSYNIDKPAEAWLSVEPPWPLTRYNAVFEWFFRDSNWSPDFPTTAEKAEWFYHEERGPEENIDGIIAVTPTFIQSLLTLTGEISVNGLTFTQENLIDTLQYQVEQGFLRQGLEESERKEIIGVLSSKILDSILDLPKSKWPDLWKVFTKDVTEKQILIFSKDQYVQEFILKENWGGAIREAMIDSVAIIDANLASLKTDPAVERSIDYRVRRDGNNTIADIAITYHNVGSITWKTTRYRSYVRVYVPLGSELLTSDGSMVDCKINEEGSIDKGEEVGKTVFGTFICVEPDEQRTLTFKYKLPNTVSAAIADGSYGLLFQKQAGAANYPLTINLELDEQPQSVTGLDNGTISVDNGILITTELSEDREVTVEL